MSVKAPLVLPPSRDAIWWFPCRLRRARWPYRFTLLLLSVVVVFSGYYAFGEAGGREKGGECRARGCCCPCHSPMPFIDCAAAPAADLESITATALRARLGINNTQFGALFS